MRYDRSGHLLWQKTLRQGVRTTFSRLAVTPEGNVFVCGTARRGHNGTDVNDDWLVARLDLDGNVAWTDTVDGPAHGADTAAQIVVDKGGDVLVAGTLQVPSKSPGGAAGLKMALWKYSPNGELLWQRVVSDSGPAVVLAGLSTIGQSDVVLGGTEQLTNGNLDIVLARYDRFGNIAQSFRCPMPNGYQSAFLKGLSLGKDELITLAGEIASSTAGGMVDRCSVFVTQCAADGHAIRHRVFDSGQSSVNLIRGSILSDHSALTGQTGSSKDIRSLTVWHY